MLYYVSNGVYYVCLIIIYLESFHPDPNSSGQYPILKFLGANSGIHFASNGAAPAIAISVLLSSVLLS